MIKKALSKIDQVMVQTSGILMVLSLIAGGVIMSVVINTLQDDPGPPPITIYALTVPDVKSLRDFRVTFDFSRTRQCHAVAIWQITKTAPFVGLWSVKYEAGGTVVSDGRRQIKLEPRWPGIPDAVIDAAEPGVYRFVYSRIDYCPDATYQGPQFVVPFNVTGPTELP